MHNIIKSFSRGFQRGMVKSVDMGNSSKPRRKEIAVGGNIQKSWENVGNSMRKAMRSLPCDS